jgi:hypothetical protein
MVAKATTEYVERADGMVIGVEFSFANGAVHRIMLTDLNPFVLAHAAANGIREGTRDTYSGAESAAAAEAAFLQRKGSMEGPAGEYAARGGSRLDWVGDIIVAARRLDPDMDDATEAKRRAFLEGLGDVEGIKSWLKNKDLKPLRDALDTLKAERKLAKSRAKAISTKTTLNW